MSDIFRLFILLGVFSLAIANDSPAKGEPWIKKKLVSDRFLMGMIRGRNALCTGMRNGVEVEGVCTSPRECTTMGGVRGGACSLLGTCCIVEKSCSETTKAKLSYFVSGQNPTPVCQLKVKPINADICQIRLDFEKFSLAKPTQPYASPAKSFQCYHDAFTVVPHLDSLGFESLCGENSNQHIYVPVGNQNEIILNFGLQPSRKEVDPKEKPNWRIKIRQLECGTPRQVLNQTSFSPLEVMHYQANKLKMPSSSNADDFSLLAPPGCLQYYPQMNGTYQSFNYNDDESIYIGKMNYAICFNKSPNVCGIRHKADYFMLSFNANVDFEIECHHKSPDSFSASNDYVFVPRGIVRGEHVEYFCDDMLKINEATSSAFGPLYVSVNADEYMQSIVSEKGFKVNYELLVNQCK